MSIIRQYPIVCPTCRGSGFIKNPDAVFGYTTMLTIICPVCQGSEIVICTETIPENVTGLDSINPAKV